MKTIAVLLALHAAVGLAQAAPDGDPLAPWLQQKISGYEALPPFSPPRAILLVRYQGRKAYYVTPACCDIPSELIDESGELLCHPDGGFAGGDGKCPAFAFVGNGAVTVWRDSRTAAARPADHAGPTAPKVR